MAYEIRELGAQFVCLAAMRSFVMDQFGHGNHLEYPHQILQRLQNEGLRVLVFFVALLESIHQQHCFLGQNHRPIRHLME